MLCPAPPSSDPCFIFQVSSNCVVKNPKGTEKKGKQVFQSKTVLNTVWNLGSFVKKIAFCYYHMSLLSPSCSSPWDTSQMPILLHADTSKLISIVNTMFLLGQTYFFTTKGNTERQYVLERLLTYTGFINDTDLLKYHCCICFFQQECIWAGLGVVKSQRPELVIYFKNANYMSFIINRNYACNRLFPFIVFICIKILFTIKAKCRLF